MRNVITGFCAFILSVSTLIATPAFATTAPTVVYPGNMHGWAFVNDDPGVGIASGALVNGPGQPPLGAGSANLVVDGTGREIFANPSDAGTLLKSITNLQYSTYVSQSGDPAAFDVSLQLDVDYDLTDTNTAWQGRLVYEPYNNGTVTTGVWQSWSPLDGKWWASGSPGNSLCPQSNPCTWNQVLTDFPNAGIRASAGNVQFKAGGPWTGGFDGNVDAFTIGVNGSDTTYDFELVSLPSDKDVCKDGGWKSLTNPSFNNQGDCISYFLSINRS